MSKEMSWSEAAQEVPNVEKGGYMKLKAGQNKFRILSAPVSGYEIWTTENKPMRWAEYPKTIPADIKPGSQPKYFWAFVVWNFGSKAVEILQLTQATIISPIQELVNSEEWGAPTGYSLTVTRKGEGLETEYTVVPSPAKETPKEILQAYKEKNINLGALLTGSNPFEPAKSSEFVPENETHTAFDDDPGF